jgi:hypothetical protein
VSTNRSSNRGAPHVNAAGVKFVVVLFVVVFTAVVATAAMQLSRFAIAVFEIAVNVAIAFVVFAAAVVVISVIVVVIVIAVRCFYSSNLLDIDRCEWRNGVSILRKVTVIYIQSDIDAPFSFVEFLSIQSTM